MALSRQPKRDDWFGRFLRCGGPPVRRWIRLLGVSLLSVLLAACGGGSPPQSIETMAYVVTWCRQAGTAMTLQQELRILHGAAEAVTVTSVGPLGPFESFACAVRGVNRSWFTPEYGPLQRLGMTPDGSGVVFELTDEFVREGRGLLPLEQRGIYYVRADGSGLRRLGPASRSPGVFYSPGGTSWVDMWLEFDPGGQVFTYTDRGPDEAGQDAAQVFVRGLGPADPTQVTRLLALGFGGQWPEVSFPSFVDAGTILFRRWIQPGAERTFLTVDLDGTHLSQVPVVTFGDGYVIPVFQIVGAQWVAFRGDVPGEPVNPHRDLSIGEVFATDGSNVLQLTSFRRVDTALQSPFYSTRDQRVYFTASADPFGTNPSENCQIFSIDALGSDLRQLTFFRDSARQATNGCASTTPPNGCRIDFGPHPSQNPKSGTIFFESNCDPFGLNPNGWQVFAMQPDGSDLQQLTNARGLFSGANDAVEVETVDRFLNGPYEF